MPLFDSPVRPFRQPRFSVTGPSSPDENLPRPSPNPVATASVFPRQFLSSPAKFSDRNVLLLMGSKVPSSVPGRRSSIACARDRKALAPLIVYEDSPLDMGEPSEVFQNPPTKSTRRAKSMKALTASKLVNTTSKQMTLKRL